MDAVGTSFRVAADLFEERRCHCGLRIGDYGNRDFGLPINRMDADRDFFGERPAGATGSVAFP